MLAHSAQHLVRAEMYICLSALDCLVCFASTAENVFESRAYIPGEMDPAITCETKVSSSDGSR
jgi:hypothetical protein